MPDDTAATAALGVPEQLALFDLNAATITEEEEAEDLAAEADDSVPADATDDDYELAEEVTGLCRGGPYDGRTVPIRFPGGFVLFDKTRALVWSYLADPEHPGEYTAPSVPLALISLDKLREAAEGSELDVLAYDEDGPAVA